MRNWDTANKSYLEFQTSNKIVQCIFLRRAEVLNNKIYFSENYLFFRYN